MFNMDFFIIIIRHELIVHFLKAALTQPAWTLIKRHLLGELKSMGTWLSDKAHERKKQQQRVTSPL